MKENRWTTILMAAVMVILAGGAIALAETVDVEVEVDSEATAVVEIKTDDSVEVFTVDDLVDGEERIIEAGEHTVTIRRTGDDITVLLDGESLDDGMAGHHQMIREMIVMGEGTGEEKKIVMVGGGHHGQKFIEFDGDGEGVKIIKIKKGEGGEDFVWHGDAGAEEFVIELTEELQEGQLAEIKVLLEEGIEGENVFFFGDDEDGDMHKVITMGGPHGVHGAHFGKVRYVCEETGSMLMVDEEYASQNTLVDPASGCLMTKVEDEEPRVIMIKKELKIIEED